MHVQKEGIHLAGSLQRGPQLLFDPIEGVDGDQTPEPRPDEIERNQLKSMLSRTDEKSANGAPAPLMRAQHGLARLHGALTTCQVDALRRKRVHTQRKSSHGNAHDRCSFLS
jgi:hypothetical protein